MGTSPSSGVKEVILFSRSGKGRLRRGCVSCAYQQAVFPCMCVGEELIHVKLRFLERCVSDKSLMSVVVHFQEKMQKKKSKSKVLRPLARMKCTHVVEFNGSFVYLFSL